MERDLSSEKFPLGSALPKFSLPNVDGKSLGSDYLKEGKASVVVFSCNHCPYVKGSDSALLEVANRYQERGVRFVAISSNDAAQYPEDNFEKMKEKSQQMKLPFPYLYDESQEVAKAFDAACTPEFYLFNDKQELVYHGTINNSPRFPNEVKDHHLSNALDQLLSGKPVSPGFVHPIGCSIKWKAA